MYVILTKRAYYDQESPTATSLLHCGMDFNACPVLKYSLLASYTLMQSQQVQSRTSRCSISSTCFTACPLFVKRLTCPTIIFPSVQEASGCLTRASHLVPSGRLGNVIGDR
jgi:hypothetical protein